MSGQDFAALAQGLGTLLLGVGSIGGLVIAIRNGRKSDRNANKIDVLTSQTNGMSARLEATSKALGVAEGIEQQRDKARRVTAR